MTGARSIAAAEELHVHKNTVKYRLGCIRDITGVDTGDPDELDYLSLSYRLARSSAGATSATNQ